MLNTILYYYGYNELHEKTIYFVAYDPGPTGRTIGKYNFKLCGDFDLKQSVRWVADHHPEYNLIPYEEIKYTEAYRQEN